MADLLIRMLIYLPERAKKGPWPVRLRRPGAPPASAYFTDSDAMLIGHSVIETQRCHFGQEKNRRQGSSVTSTRIRRRLRINALKREVPVSTTSSKSCTHTRGKSATHNHAFAAASIRGGSSRGACRSINVAFVAGNLI
jgi:hypothetical protein